MPVALLALLLSAASPPLKMTVQSGQIASVTLYYPAGPALLSRQAPNIARFKTPWGSAEAQPSGLPHPDPQFSGYFGKVNPVRLKIQVPSSAPAGAYVGRITAQLFICDQQQKTCSRKDVSLPLALQVVKAGETSANQSINLRLDASPLLQLVP